MSSANALKKGDRVLWTEDHGESYPVTILEAPGITHQARIELDNYPQDLLYGKMGKIQIVAQERLVIVENLQIAVQKADEDRLYAARFFEQALESQGCPLSLKQKIVTWAALEHILLKEKLGLKWSQ